MVFVQQMMDAPTTAATIVAALAATDDFTTIDEDAMLPVTAGVWKYRPSLGGYTQPGTCLQHTPTNTYVTIGVTRLNGGWSVADYTQYGVPGIAVSFSTEWDMENHHASGTIYQGMIPYRNERSNNANNLTLLASPYEFSTALYVDKFGFQMVVNNSYSGGHPVMVSCEFFPTAWMEYDDTRTPIVFYTLGNSVVWGNASGDTEHTASDCHTFVRPFGYATQTNPENNNGAYLTTCRRAYRNTMNNKVYFEFPWYHQDNNVTCAIPIAQTRRWFPVDKVNGSFNLQDVINWIDPDGVTVHKYIVVAMTADKYFAIPYANAFDYTVSDKY